ncbi:hypothetical protein V8E51_018768 [Hyaloscypha variabilis]|jgi:hypothetical protein|uniref:Uncharacterized protein n=1 Tax=Hyaloscypha variabilis (strain UAMH 11265 / GT02V1 / F) TaxID=1149755 RepID=A0A2J6R7Z6_HYAVF|nr:hypothetical protein L207DRAFT_516780 [Hyaloscypha variabilis F]
MSQLAPLLRQLTRKASHPNGLMYGVQLERARVKYLVKGELEDGKGAVELGAPEEPVTELKNADEQEDEGQLANVEGSEGEVKVEGEGGGGKKG